MQQFMQHVRQELSGLYSPSEISVLARRILEEICGSSFANITAHKISNLSGFQTRKAEDILERLKEGEPLQYVLGKADFYGMVFTITPDVLIPRPETEELVEWILSETQSGKRIVLDIGTGSGCIAVALAKKRFDAEVYAWDISDKALEVAARNASRNGVSIRFSRQDILHTVPTDMRYDVIVSNPPYVLESEKEAMERNVLDFEPHEALFVPDEDPLLFYERIADVAIEILKDKGRLYFEINRSKGEDIQGMLQHRGFVSIELRRDLSGNYRMIRAEKPEYHG
jgi:protein-(glutamine-N5) methyltransferase, release factor-specific